ncbi:hypothetical protein N0V93_008210 [Gnomoniopsis smithogilvyi]|uniref:Rhodopsin domain-containing protein n=1 Tax=Gnomoniopsis smithogilvyi TaxID=1191159 RepID=A0A9W8YMJ2_9PEZI|nr:hypothetical protein N0V93_008210 [Gnomoniopsis smithogilvyi]
MWNPNPGGSYRDGTISDYSTLAINMLLDLAVFILPLPTLWSLNMAPRKKVVVTIMFSFGLATIAVMIWRVVWTHQYRTNPDFTTYLGWIGLVSQFELWLGLIVACIPTLAPLFKTFVSPALKTNHEKVSVA